MRVATWPYARVILTQPDLEDDLADLCFSVNALMVEVRVDSTAEGETFHVCADMASKHSMYFAARLSPRWKLSGEQKQNFVDLADDTTARAFQVFDTFLQTGKICLTSSNAEGEEQDDSVVGASTSGDDWEYVAEAWLLGDRIVSASFRDAITDETVSIMKQTGKSPLDMYLQIFKGSVGSSGMRKLLVDVAVQEMSEGTIRGQPRDEGNVDFFVDLSAALMKANAALIRGFPDSTPRKARYEKPGLGCRYHDHWAIGEPCYKKTFELTDKLPDKVTN